MYQTKQRTLETILGNFVNNLFFSYPLRADSQAAGQVVSWSRNVYL